MIQIATGDLAAVPASREELQALCSTLYEQLQEAKDELRTTSESWRNLNDAYAKLDRIHREDKQHYRALREWADAMPLRATVEDVAEWMAQRPEPECK